MYADVVADVVVSLHDQLFNRVARRSLFLCLLIPVQLEIPVPDDVTKRKTTLELDPSGDRMHLSFKNRPDFEPLEGKFKDLISPLDSVWMLGKRAFSQTRQ